MKEHCFWKIRYKALTYSTSKSNKVRLLQFKGKVYLGILPLESQSPMW